MFAKRCNRGTVSYMKGEGLDQGRSPGELHYAKIMDSWHNRRMTGQGSITRKYTSDTWVSQSVTQQLHPQLTVKPGNICFGSCFVHWLLDCFLLQIHLNYFSLLQD